MNIRERRAVHEAARSTLQQADKHRNIILVYTAISCALSVAVTAGSILLGNRISGAGGLSNIGLRSVLSTGQNVLPLINLVITACLTMGYHTAILSITRGFDASPQTLKSGFRHFGPVFRTLLMQCLIYLGIGLAAMYISSSIFMATPLADPFLEAMEPYMSTITGSSVVVDEAILAAAADSLIPMMWILAAVCLVLVVPVYYRFRMVNFCLADDPQKGALHALLKSRYLMRRNCFALFRLDLSMWWFYAGQLAVYLLCYGDILLPLAGISLPFDAMVSYYLFYALSLAAQIALYYFTMNRVYAVYAVAYDALQENLPKPEVPAEM